MIAASKIAREDVSSYGLITPKAQEGNPIEVADLVEKPTVAKAPSRLAVIGRYILQPQIFSKLDKMESGAGGEIQVTDSLAQLIGQMPFHALTFDGQYYDCGKRLGFLQANIACGLEREGLGARLEEWLKDLIR